MDTTYEYDYVRVSGKDMATILIQFNQMGREGWQIQVLQKEITPEGFIKMDVVLMRENKGKRQKDSF